jgi:hypothetical protein
VPDHDLVKGDRAFIRDVLGVPFVPPGRLTRAAVRVRAGLLRTHRSSAPPSVRVLESLFGLFENRVLGMLVELGIPDLLDGPATVDRLAESTGSGPDALRRVLRYAAARGFISCDRQGRYRANAVTKVLSRAHPNSWRGWVEFATGDWFWDSWRHADAAVGSSEESGIERATGHDFFHYVTKVNPEAGRAFNSAMEAGSALQGIALSRGLRWRRVETVCDVGGGTGAALESLLRLHPHLKATLFELPEVVAEARPTLSSGPLAARCEIIGGDFFASVPEGRDRYLMLAVVHDWDDDRAAQILRNVGKALTKDGARAVVVESVLPESPRDDFVTPSDLLMLVFGSGRERTQGQYEELFAAAGLTLERQTVLPSGSTAFELTGP